MLVENRENYENSRKSNKIVKTHAGRKMTAKRFVEIWILSLETPKET